MKKKRFTDEQIIGILREQEAGAKAADLARRYAVSETTLVENGAVFVWFRLVVAGQSVSVM